MACPRVQLRGRSTKVRIFAQEHKCFGARNSSPSNIPTHEWTNPKCQSVRHCHTFQLRHPCDIIFQLNRTDSGSGTQRRYWTIGKREASRHVEERGGYIRSHQGTVRIKGLYLPCACILVSSSHLANVFLNAIRCRENVLQDSAQGSGLHSGRVSGSRSSSLDRCIPIQIQPSAMV